MWLAENSSFQTRCVSDYWGSLLIRTLIPGNSDLVSGKTWESVLLTRVMGYWDAAGPPAML